MSHEHHHHEHEHEHEDEGHEHHHHDHGHETALLENGTSKLTMMDHQGSLVASYRFTLAQSVDEAKKTMADLATQIAESVTEQGGIVGHIKAVARNHQGGFRISVTFHDPTIADMEGSSVEIEGVAIVLGVDREWYEGYLSDLLAPYIVS